MSETTELTKNLIRNRVVRGDSPSTIVEYINSHLDPAAKDILVREYVSKLVFGEVREVHGSQGS